MSNASSSSKHASLRSIEESLSGIAGGVLSATAIYPLDLAKTRLQVQDADAHSPTTVLGVIAHVLHHEGVSGIYRGLLSEYVKIAVQNGVYFGIYSMLKEKYGGQSKLSISTNLVLGVVAGAVTQLFANPLSVVQTREQTQETGKGGFWHTLLQIVSTEGASALYKGMVPALVLTTNPAIQFVVFDRLKAFWVGQKRRVQLKDSSSEYKTDASVQLSAIELLIIGATAKIIATIVTYPYIFAKVRLQWGRSVAGQRARYRGTLDVLHQVIRSDGIFGIYKGMRAQIFKSALGAALMFMFKEKIHNAVSVAFNKLTKASSDFRSSSPDSSE